MRSPTRREDWKFKTSPDPLEFTKATPESSANILIYTSSDSDGFDSDSFSNIGYSQKSNGEDISLLTQGVHYSITKNNLTIFGSW